MFIIDRLFMGDFYISGLYLIKLTKNLLEVKKFVVSN